MPPIAEEMAGGGPSGGAGQQPQKQPSQQQQQQPSQSQKKPHRGPSHKLPHSTAERAGKKLSRQQHQQQQQQQQHTGSELEVPVAARLTVSQGSTPGSSGRSNSLAFSLSDTSFVDDNIEPVSQTSMIAGLTAKPTAVAAIMDRYSSDPNLATEFFKKEPCIYSHRMFLRAAKIFDNLKKVREAKMERRKTGGRAGPARTGAESEMEPLDFKNATEQKLTYELAFATLRFEMVFEDMLDDCSFFTIYPELRDDVSIVLVVLWDYQSRKFQPRIQFDADELSDYVGKIERAILDQKIKLGASLARRRIKEAAPTIDYLLPDNLRKKSTNQKALPVYVWVNTLKMSPAELLMKVKAEGFLQLWEAPKLPADWKKKSFYLDIHCSDLLVFSPDCNALLQEHSLIEEGYMVKQDKSSCLAAHSVVHLLGDEQDAAVVNEGSGMTSAHLAVLLMGRKGGVVVITDHSEEDHNKMMRRFELIGVSKYMKVVRDRFVDMDPEDQRLKGIRAALVAADCSKSAVNNIVNYIVTEGENLKLLQDVSDQTEDMDEHMNSLQTNHVALLRHALKLPGVHGVTYLTRSVYEEENDVVVQRAIEYVNTVQMARKLRPWRVIPPVLPFSGDEIDEQKGIVGKLAYFKPDDFMNGCFLVCIAREPEDPLEAARRARTGSKTLVGKGSKSKVKATGSSSGSDVAKPSRKGVKKSKNAKVSSAREGSNSHSGSNSGSNSGSSSSANGSPTHSRPPRQTRERVPEHVRVVKHPAPFR